MRCISRCIASSFDLNELRRSLQEKYKFTRYRDAIHWELQSSSGHKDIFVFDYGSLVSWGLTEKQEQEILNLLIPFQQQPLTQPVHEDLDYSLGSTAKIENDILTLPNKETLTLLAISHGLAQSVKLETFESTIQSIYNRTKYIPEELAIKGNVSLSRRQIRRMMGSLFIARSYVNLHFEVLDTPEFFWEEPEVEKYYTLISSDLELKSRVGVLNERLNVVHELFEMLGNELNHQHSSRLEWTIIILIVIEVIILLTHDVFKWF